MKKFKEVINEDHVDVKDMSDVQLCRKGMVEEIKAINLYEQMAAQATDARVRELLLDIAEEEKVHMVEFEELMERLDPSWEEVEEEGEQESEDMFGPENETE